LNSGLQCGRAVRRVTGYLEQAVPCFEEVLAMGRARGDARAIYTPLSSLGDIARDREEWAAATMRYAEAMAISRAAGHNDHVGSVLLRMGEVALRQHDERRAAALLREAVEMFQAAQMLWATTSALELLATAYARMGLEERAARLLGAAATGREAIKAPFVSAQQPYFEATVAPARAALSEGPWAAAFAAGRAMTLEEASAEAQQGLPDQPEGKTGVEATDAATVAAGSGPLALGQRASAPQTAHVGAEQLTRRQLEVLRLLAQGWSDAQIAERLVISVRTVNHHVTAIYSKLGVSSRVAATRSALDDRLL